MERGLRRLGSDDAKSVQQTADGGYVAVGYSNNSFLGFVDGPWLLKLDANGDVSGCPEGIILGTSARLVSTDVTITAGPVTAQDTTITPLTIVPTVSLVPTALQSSSIHREPGRHHNNGESGYDGVHTGPQGLMLNATVVAGSTVDDGTVTFTVKNGLAVIGVAVTSGTVTDWYCSCHLHLPHGDPGRRCTIDGGVQRRTGL